MCLLCVVNHQSPNRYKITFDLVYQPFLADVRNLLEHVRWKQKTDGGERGGLILPRSEANYFAVAFKNSDEAHYKVLQIKIHKRPFSSSDCMKRISKNDALL